MDRSRVKTYASVRQFGDHPKQRALSGTMQSPPYEDPLVFDTADLARPPPDPLPPDQLLNASTEERDLNLTVRFPHDGDLDDTIQLVIASAPVGTSYVLGDIASDDLSELTVPFPAALRTAAGEGAHALNYVVHFDSGGEGDTYGPAGQTFKTDYTAPSEGYVLAKLIFAEDITDGGVTIDKLQGTAPNQYLPATVAGYEGLEPGDTIIGMINDQDISAPSEVAGTPIELQFPRSAIEVHNDGKLAFAYKVRDRAGNISAPSEVATLDVLLKGGIDDLAAPRVPSYDDDDDADGTVPKVIDEADARIDGGLIVQIPPHDLLQANDQIYLLWGSTTEVGPVPVTNPTADPAAVIYVPYAAISDTWHADGNDIDTAKPVDVTYRAVRGIPLGPPSAANSVQVNIHVAGGKDPDPETPENENLDLPVLTSASDQENEIPKEDFESDATIEVPWFRVNHPTEAAFIEGDIITVRYGSEGLTPYTVTSDDVTNQFIPPFTLPAASIGKVGSGTIALHYTVSRTLQSGGANIVASPKQPIEVHGTDELPGGGELLAGTVPEAEGTYPGDPDRLLIGKVQARDGTDFVIPEYRNQAPTDTIVLTMTVFRFFYGSHSDAMPITERDVEASGNPSATTGETRIHLTEHELMRYDLVTAPLHAHLEYMITNGAGTVTSRELLLDLDPRGQI